MTDYTKDESLPSHWVCAKPGLIWSRADGLALELEGTPGLGWGLPRPTAWVWATHTRDAAWNLELTEQRFLIEWFSQRAWTEEIAAKLIADQDQGKKNKFMRPDRDYSLLSLINLLDQGVGQREERAQ